MGFDDINSTILTLHWIYCELFICLDFKYLKSYHDINIFHQLNIHKSQYQYFVHTNEYFQYLLGDPSYMAFD
jgi:hypothetical protein